MYACNISWKLELHIDSSIFLVCMPDGVREDFDVNLHRDSYKSAGAERSSP